MTCCQACRSFEIFIICLAFLLIQKVNVAAITVKSTARELDGESFSNCPGTFMRQFSAINFCGDLSYHQTQLNSNKKVEIERNGIVICQCNCYVQINTQKDVLSVPIKDQN